MRLTLISLCLLLIIDSVNAQTYSNFILVDQFGYTEASDKVAVIRDPIVGYDSNQSFSPSNVLEVRDAITNSVVFSGAATQWNGGATQADSGDRGWWFDFSSVNAVGEYYIFDVANNERSANFKIADDVYYDVLKAAVKMYYYNRCGTAKTTPYADPNWTDAASFLNPLQDLNARFIDDPNNAALEKDVSGGWYDAGDFNKYVTFTYGAIPNLLWAYQENPQLFTDDWNIPESGNGIPDILDEVIWELEWLMKMNNADGSTHIKAGSQNYSDNISSPPSLNTDPRFYGPTCSSASICVSAIFAQAALVLQNFSSLNSLVTDLENRSITAWNYALPYLQNNSWEVNCDDGSIISGDADWQAAVQTEVAVAAAIYLKDLTGSNIYDNYITTYAPSTEPLVNSYYAPYKISLIDALLHYTSLPTANASLSNNIISSLTNDATNNWNGYFGFNNNDLYRAFIPTWSWHWGSIGVFSNYGNLNFLLDKYNINAPASSTALYKVMEHAHYIHGVNPLSMVYLSNMYGFGAENSANEIYHQWFNDGTQWDTNPAPGYVVGGPNASTSVPFSPPANQPAMKSYLDFNDGYPFSSWEISEPSITYQGPYIRMLSHLTSLSTVVGVPNIGLSNSCIEVFPNPTNNIFTITGTLPQYNIDIIDANGNVYSNINNVGTEINIDMSSLPSGTFIVRITDPNNNQMCVEKILKF